jgi:dihydrofolate reductase
MEAIFAIDSKNGIAKNGNIPWKSKKDMDFFKYKTMNKIVIMGRKTYESIKPLKNRLNVVLTTNPQYSEYNNILFTDNIDQLLNENVFFIGGKTIYEQFIPLCEKLWVTQFKKDYDCDLFFHCDFTDFHAEIYEETDELTITEYSRIYNL